MPLNSTLKVKVTIKREEFHENRGQECQKQIIQHFTGIISPQV